MAIRMNQDGYYIKCDKCGATQRLPGIHQPGVTMTDSKFYENARYIMQYNYAWENISGGDFCPECNPNVMTRDLSVSDSSFTGKLINDWVIAQMLREEPDYLQAMAVELHNAYWGNNATMSPPSPDVYYFVRENRYGPFLKRDQERSPRKGVA